MVERTAARTGMVRREVVVCDHVINCAGVWAGEINFMAGCAAPPLSLLQHQHCVTEAVELEGSATEGRAVAGMDENRGGPRGPPTTGGEGESVEESNKNSDAFRAESNNKTAVENKRRNKNDEELEDDDFPGTNIVATPGALGAIPPARERSEALPIGRRPSYDEEKDG